MSPVIDSRLPALAEVMVRVGVNLQPGQPLLITEPYELQGVHPETEPLIAAIAAVAAGSTVRVITADPPRLRALAADNDHRGYETLVSGHIQQLDRHLADGGAFLFLQGSQPQLMAGLPADRLARFDLVKWRHLGPLIQRLVRGATQWTLAPVPSTSWADVAFPELPAADRLTALWQSVFAALRVAPTGDPAHPPVDPIGQWQNHLALLARRRTELDIARHRRVRFTGPGTDLTFDLPRSHAWCTAQLVSKTGVPFVANLPTEEVFTAPHKNSATGLARITRPIVHGGSTIEGLELEFNRGRVVGARARTGQDALEHLLATDSGACRIGEVALVTDRPRWASVATPTLVAVGDIGDHPVPRLFHHTLLDENAAHHIALGQAYRFCSRAWLPFALNSSQVHLDLPLDAKIELS